MKVIKNVRDMQLVSDRLRKEGKTIGFVPTMGYLHDGHLSLIRIAAEKADVVVVSVFVNPTQFGPTEDLARYPRDFNNDKILSKEAGAHILFFPSVEGMYPDGFLTAVHVNTITEKLCGASRPGHFQGVTTVCTKLFQIVKPHFAVFGQKDFQQAVVIKRMVADLNMDLEIITGPIVREEDGLAMSSRNTYLSMEERADALSLKQSLDMAVNMIREGESKTDVVIQTMRHHIESKKHTRIDYISIVHPDTLENVQTVDDEVLIAMAVFVGKTRLIDNCLVVV